MPIKTEDHPGYRTVGQRMRLLVERYHDDLGALQFAPLDQFFRWVSDIPYIEDKDLLPGLALREVLCRPSRALKMPALDCKKKAILIASWARCRNIPYRFFAVAEYPATEIHHVRTEILAKGRWWNVDPTMPGSILSDPPHEAKRVSI